MVTVEQDLRLKLLNALLTTPHKDLGSIYPVHQEILDKDPRFYVRLGAWYADEGEVRDHKEIFVASLSMSTFPGHRDVGLALLRRMPPYEVARVVDFIKGKVVNRRVKHGRRTEVISEKQGMFRNVPRSMRTEIARYLREREGDTEWFDSTVLQARSAMKRLYAGLHIAPPDRVQAVLFDDAPPEDSRLFALKSIAKAKTPSEQARAIVDNKIPYRVASSVIKQLTPTVLVALIHQMTPQEAINSLGSLKRRGAMDNPEVKALIEEKIEQAKTDDRVSAFKAKKAVEVAGVSQEMADQLDAVTEARVEAKGKIVRSTALLIDKSGSMEEAIEIGKRVASLIAGICEAELFVYAFDTIGYPIDGTRPFRSGRIRNFIADLLEGGAQKQTPETVPEEGGKLTLSDWEKALEGIKAGGGTSCGVPIEMMRRQKQTVEQIIMVTDEEENESPRFVSTFKRYRSELQAAPHVIFVKTRGASINLEEECREENISFDTYQFEGDYYSLPNLVPLLTRPSRLDLLLDIMAHPLPSRKTS
jgi:hypothetical protein